jgi:hypothetical protein
VASSNLTDDDPLHRRSASKTSSSDHIASIEIGNRLIIDKDGLGNDCRCKYCSPDPCCDGSVITQFLLVGLRLKARRSARVGVASVALSLKSVESILALRRDAACHEECSGKDKHDLLFHFDFLYFKRGLGC